MVHDPLIRYSLCLLRQVPGPSTRVLLLSLLDAMLSRVLIIHPNFLATPRSLPLVSMLQPCLMGALG